MLLFVLHLDAEPHNIPFGSQVWMTLVSEVILVILTAKMVCIRQLKEIKEAEISSNAAIKHSTAPIEEKLYELKKKVACHAQSLAATNRVTEQLNWLTVDSFFMSCSISWMASLSVDVLSLILCNDRNLI